MCWVNTELPVKQHVDCGMVGSVALHYRLRADPIAIYCLEQSPLVNTFLRDLADPANHVRIAGMHRSNHARKEIPFNCILSKEATYLQYLSTTSWAATLQTKCGELARPSRWALPPPYFPVLSRKVSLSSYGFRGSSANR